MMDQSRMAYLYERYQGNRLTAAELAEWERLLLDVSRDGELQQLIDRDWHAGDGLPALASAEEQERIYRFIVGQAQRRGKRIAIRRWLPYAAAVALLAIGVGALLLGRQDPEIQRLQPMAQNGIAPGGNRAILMLDDGSAIELSADQGGIVIGEDITYNDGSKVFGTDGNALAQGVTNRLVVPKGGTYQVTLPDGTEVWLNAESTLRYPGRFGADRRLVMLEGEAYFDVFSDSGRPFVVSTRGEEIEVLGTQFNVTSYPNEPMTKTTLVEGKVKVRNVASGQAFVLDPDQQSVSEGATTRVQQVAAMQFTAWKDGFFFFENTPFTDVLEQLARWYDIKISYQHRPTKTFSGKMKRDAQLASVLDFFEDSGIRFDLDGRTLNIY